jgi:hypothetical protein
MKGLGRTPRNLKSWTAPIFGYYGVRYILQYVCTEIKGEVGAKPRQSGAFPDSPSNRKLSITQGNEKQKKKWRRGHLRGLL